MRRYASEQIFNLGVYTYMGTNRISIRALDSFSIYDYEGNIITLGNKPKKLWQLFKLLLLNSNQPVHYEFVYEQLSFDKSCDIHNLIKNMIYRLRKHLYALDLYHEDLICIDNVSENYILKLGKNVDLDLIQLQDLSTNEKQICGIKEINTIGYELFPEERYAEWLLQKRSYYYSLFATICIRTAESLYRNGKYDDALTLSKRVLEIYPDDETVSSIILRSYIEQGKRVKALKYYYELEDRLFEDYGLDPSDELQKIAEDLNEVQISTKETCAKLQGAMWCSPKEFRTIMQHERRKHERGENMPIYCKFKVRSRLNTPQVIKTINTICNIITDSLRLCDVVSEESIGTYNVLLFNTTKEHVSTIEDRIKRKIIASHMMNDIHYQIEFD